VQTAEIGYRVVDFLKENPPFQAIPEEDLLELARQGRVRFFEKGEFILWQGASRFEILVLQQGVATLWEDVGDISELRDVRGAGDMLGIDRFHEVSTYPYTARAATDVLVYAFPADAVEELIFKHPYAQQYVSVYGNVNPDFQSPEELRNPQKVFVHDLVGRKTFATCDPNVSVRDAARQLLSGSEEVLVVVDSKRNVQGVVTSRSLIEWIAKGEGDPRQPVTSLSLEQPHTVAYNACVSDAVLELSTTGGQVLIITSQEESDTRPHALVTAQDLNKVFGDQPLAILREIRTASGTSVLRELNQRARAFALQYLTGASSVDWLARFISSVDSEIVKRIIALQSLGEPLACWCFCGASGRNETLVAALPQLVGIFPDPHEPSQAVRAYESVLSALKECGYLPNTELPFERDFYAARLAEWRRRYEDWVRDPILQQMYQARPLFDLRPIFGPPTLWHEIESAVTNAVDDAFMHVMANDCLASLPPLTFFQGAVVEESGDHTAVFRLEESALRPLVDVGRVFGFAARKALGTSTLERFAMARSLLPARQSIFRDASETLRVLLWQQSRVGISQGAAGAELPPNLLSRYDRQVLRNGFRSILRLLEFTADREWLRIR
jgi:CBS domain-containing protein